MSAHAAAGPVDAPSLGQRRQREVSPAPDAGLLEAVRTSVLADAGPVTASRVAAAVQASGRLLGTAGSLAAVETISAERHRLGSAATAFFR